MVRFILLIGLLVFSSNAMAGKECTCSHKGEKIPEGQKACIKTPKGMQMAQCSRVLNNTSWKFLGTPCPTATLTRDKKSQTEFDLLKSIKMIEKYS